MNLYQITSEIRAIVAGMEDELGDDAEKQFDSLQMDFTEKVKSIALSIQEASATAEAAKSERLRIQDIEDAANDKIRRLKRYLLNAMQSLGQTRVDANIVKVRIQRNSQPTVVVESMPSDLPEWAKRVKVIVEPDAKALAEAASKGEPLPDGVTVYTGSHVRIS